MPNQKQGLFFKFDPTTPFQYIEKNQRTTREQKVSQQNGDRRLVELRVKWRSKRAHQEHFVLL